MNQMLNVTRKFMGDEQFLRYNVLLNNCQDFIHNISKYNSMSSSLNDEFIFHKREHLFNNSSRFQQLAIDISGVNTISSLLADRKFQLSLSRIPIINKQKGSAEQQCIIN
jgi:hypothetical protein